MLALAQVRDAVRAVRDAVDLVYGRGALPLVVGGDCSFAIGALAGARRHHARVAACFLDGHVDCYDGSTSPTGEVADMDIGIVCGAGPAALRGLDGAPDPLVRPGDCVVIGNRFDPADDAHDERELAPPLLQQISGPQLRRGDAGEIGAAIAERLAAQAGAIWLHIDCDVLDEAVMPAVTYAQPHGATWDDLEALVGAFAARPELVGVSLADLVPVRDPGGESTARLAQLVAAALRTCVGPRRRTRLPARWPCPSSSTATPAWTTRSPSCSRSRAPRSSCSRSRPSRATCRSRRRRATRCACSRSRGARTSRSPPAPRGRSSCAR